MGVEKPPRQPLSLTITFPCHNEEANVETVTRQAIEVGRRVADDLEVVVVNDGSTDRTGAIADQLAEEFPEVRVVHNNPNRGYGGALKAGQLAATKDWVFYTDGDGQFDMNEIDKLLPLLEQADIATAYRIKRVEGFKRKLNSLLWTSLVNVLFNLWIRDIDCAFKIYPRQVFEVIEIKSNGALIDAETLAKAKRAGFTMAQVGVTHLPRTAGESSGANLKVILRAFRELFTLYFDIRRTPRLR